MAQNPTSVSQAGYDRESRGRQATVPSDIPMKGWRDIVWRLYDRLLRDRIMLIAGGVTFYVLLALFPALAAFVSLFGLVADPSLISDFLGTLGDVLPDAGIELIQGQLATLTAQPTSALTFGVVASLALAFWSAINGVKAILEALNIAYEEEEKRSFLRLTLIAFVFTLGAMLGVVIVVIAMGVIPAVMAFIRLDGLTEILIRVMRWPILLVCFTSGIAMLYRFGPSRAQAQWRWITWGSGLATAVWLVASIGFSWYLESFADYNATYGSLGALVGFLLWVWISAIILIVGAELNAEMEHQTARDTTRFPEKPMGERGAVMADTLGKIAD